MKSQISLALLLLVLVAGLFRAAETASQAAGDDLAALCDNKKIGLTRKSQLSALTAKAVRNDPSGAKCDQTTKLALVELKKLVRTGNDVCSLEYIDRFKNFYTEYLDRSSQGAKKRPELPQVLQKFALAYGMQISNACKRRMMDVINFQAFKALEKEDYSQFEAFIGEDGVITEFLGGIAKPDDVFLPTDLALIFKAGVSNGKGEKLYLLSQTDTAISNIQFVCSRRFKPVYEPIMMPLVQLAKFGFSYRNKGLSYRLEDANVAEKVGTWSRIVFLCEALDEIEMVKGPEDPNQPEASARLVRILTKEQAAAFKAKLAKSRGNGDEDKVVFGRQVKLIDFKPAYQGVVDGDEILPNSDESLLRAVANFKTSSSELDRLRLVLKDRGLAILKSEMKNHHFGLLVKAPYEAALHKMKLSKTPLDARMEIVKSINSMLEESMRQENAVGFHEFGPGANGQDPLRRKSKSGKTGLSKTTLVIIGILILCFLWWFLFLGGYGTIVAAVNG